MDHDNKQHTHRIQVPSSRVASPRLCPSPSPPLWSCPSHPVAPRVHSPTHATHTRPPQRIGYPAPDTHINPTHEATKPTLVFSTSCDACFTSVWRCSDVSLPPPPDAPIHTHQSRCAPCAPRRGSGFSCPHNTTAHTATATATRDTYLGSGTLRMAPSATGLRFRPDSRMAFSTVGIICPQAHVHARTHT